MSIVDILQWLIPSGGLGAAIAWLASRSVRKARTVKEVHDAYKTMYEDVQKSLIEIRHENEKLYKAIHKLERAVNRATLCGYWDTCPVRSVLQDGEKCNGRKNASKSSDLGQCRNGDANDKNAADIGSESGDDSSDTESL